VSLHDLPAAVESEDDVVALMTVAALLRLTLAGKPLTHSLPDRVSEGGILGAWIAGAASSEDGSFAMAAT
jgi:hypothetical protein